MYDYIIVGAGSAGCVLANRLSADPDVKVLLIEAGGPDRSAMIHMPAGISKLGNADVNWGYETVPQARLANRRLYWPRGKTLGGSSSINAMVYIRGHRLDYDLWRQLGNEGWSYDDVLPYFRRSEGNRRGADAFHGAEGPLTVSDHVYRNPLTSVFVEAAAQAGLPRNGDFNGEAQEGIGFYQVTQRDGRRCSSADAYLRPVLGRPNLTIVTKALTTRLLIERQRAVGIEYLHEGKIEQARAEREVVLSGGAINSPQILLLSGIGPADELAKAGVPVTHDLPGVGKNLQDHLNVNVLHGVNRPITYDGLDRPLPSVKVGLQYLLFKNGPGTSNIAEAGGFVRGEVGAEAPDIQLHFLPVMVLDHARQKLPGHGVTLHACVLRPESRGEIRLASTRPQDAPAIDPNYLAAPYDLKVLIRGLRLSREILAQSAFAPYRDAERLPGAARVSEAELEEFVRTTAETEYHPVGTCKMGTDALAVVDATLKVRGMEGLRVADASIMPTLIGGNTNAPSIMIGERAADFMLQAAGRVAQPDGRRVA